jgi:hypothetical protein
MIFTFHQILLGDQIKKNLMSRACGTNGGEYMCIQLFCGARGDGIELNYKQH